MNSHRIWWIASYPKSGNTWVRMFLNAYVSGFPVNINSAFQYASGDLMPHMYQLTAAQPIDRMNDVDQFYYRPAVLMNFLYSAATRDVALKTHHARVEVDGVPLIPPRLSKGALYVVRDPRDVAVSFAKHLDVDVGQAIELMVSNETTLDKRDSKLFHLLTSWSSHVDSWTLSNKTVPTVVIRYEDMVREPEMTFSRVLDGLGFQDVDEGRLNFALEQSSFNQLRSQEVAKGFKENGRGKRFFDEGRIGRWQEVLSNDERETIEVTFKNAMARFGYLRKGTSQNMRRVTSLASATVT